MSDLHLRLVLEAEVARARAALAETRAALAETAGRAEAAGAAGARAGQEIARGAAAAAAGLRETAAAAEAAARAGGAQMGNLVAQINDIGQMVAAGQNPLVLALQQGTQLAQVLGPMGAGGALRAFGQALLSALNPVNLAVIGLTAGVAVLGQWAAAALAAGDGTADLAETMEQLRRAAEAAQRAQQAAARPIEDQIARYGRLAGAVREAIAAERTLAEAQARRQLAEAVAALPFARLGGLETIEAMAAPAAGMLARQAAARAALEAARAERDRLIAARAGGAAIGEAEAAVQRLTRALAEPDIEAARAGEGLPRRTCPPGPRRRRPCWPGSPPPSARSPRPTPPPAARPAGSPS